MRVVTFVSTMLASMALAMALHACEDGEDGESGESGEDGAPVVLDCEALCEEAQSGDCTSITGDCDDFCAAMRNVEDEAECADERSLYESCLNDGGVCDADCDSEEGDLTACLNVYCATRLTEPDCMTLVESF